MQFNTLSRAVFPPRTVILHLFSSAVALSILTTAAAPQDPDQLERHLRNVFLERRLALEEAWEVAPADHIPYTRADCDPPAFLRTPRSTTSQKRSISSGVV